MINMLKKSLISGIAIAGMTLALSSPVLAASQGAKNGQPFLALSAEIAANSALIEANQSDITNLQADVSGLKQQVGAIETNITNLESLITSNASDIQIAFGQIANAQNDIATAQGDIEALSRSLMALADQHQIDLGQIAFAISGLQVDLSNLAAMSALLAAELNAKITEVRNAAEANSSSLDNLILDIVLINAELTTVNSNYNLLTEQVTSLQGDLGVYANDLAAFEDALNALNSRVTTLEGFHITDAVCGSNGEFCKDLPWVYIDVENGLAWAWASPCSGGCSQINLAGRNGDLEGWRFASLEEWDLKPAKSEFGGQGFGGAAPGNTICAARIFDNRFNHCDYTDNPVRIPDGSWNEQWVVHNLFTTP